MWSNREYIYWGYLMFFMLVGPVIIVSSARNDERNCGEISAEDCLKRLQTFLTLKSLPYPSEETELNRLCIQSIEGYNCSAAKDSNPTCLSPRDKDIFPTFIQMAQFLVYMFCIQQDGSIGYRRGDLLKSSECILKQKEALDCCAEGSKLTNFPVMYILEKSNKSIKDRQMAACCPIANYLKCAVPIVEKNCGKLAANLTTEYVRRASGETLEAVCQQMPDYPELDTDVCELPPATCSGCRIVVLFELITLMSIIFITKISYF